MDEKQLYVRVRGKVTGPFGFQQLKSLRDRGQFRRFHEVSEDRKSWTPASSIAELFPQTDNRSGGQPGQSAEAQTTGVLKQPRSAAAAMQGAALWYYVDGDGKEIGLVSREHLVELWQSGTILPTTLVWKEGMNDWAELSSVDAGVTSLKHSKPFSTGMLATLSFIFGLLWFGGVGSIVAIILGFLAIRRMNREKPNVRGKGLAVAGLMLGFIWLAATPIIVALIFGLFPFHGTIMQRLSTSATPEEITETYRDRVYFVQTDKASGSGILLANKGKRGLIATNLHVIDPELEAKPELKKIMAGQIPKEIKVSVKNPTQLNFGQARVAALYRNSDLALLITELSAEGSRGVRVIKQRSLKQGESAVALGNPRGLEFFTSSGVISSTSGEMGYIWTTCPLSSGNSGGPLILSRRGLLAGITTIASSGKLPGVSQNLNGAVPAEDIILSLRNRQSDSWIWAHDLKELTFDLAELVILEE